MPIIIPPPAPKTGWEYIPLSEQLDNHDEFRPPLSDGLVGKTFAARFTHGPSGQIAFDSATEFTWASSIPILASGESGVGHYEAFEIRDGIHGVVIADLAERMSALVILDEGRGRALINLSQIVDVEGEPREHTTYLQCGLDGELREPFEPTTELVGKRVHQRYSSTHAFEHIYLNPNTYAFQCLEGPEAGLADVDPCDYFKLDEALYLFGWHERGQPFNGAVVVDLREQRARGRLFGWNAPTQEALQVRTGTTVTLLNETIYEGR